MNNSIVFVDSEVTMDGQKLVDLGAIKANDEQFHENNKKAFSQFLKGCEFVCGHNIIHHDLKYIGDLFDNTIEPIYIDTLYLSPLLFPRKPYHKLLKDYILQSDELNNPLNDAILARQLFYDEVNAFQALSSKLKWIFCALLYKFSEFQGFFKYLNFKPYPLKDSSIKQEFQNKICANADVEYFMQNNPIELAYALALIACNDRESLTPPWVLKNYPRVETVIKALKNTPCNDGCEYCKARLDVKVQLKKFFGFDEFRKYDGEPLQEKAAQAAVQDKSLLAVFPTGGGKSITFQLPALMAGNTMHGLTVVISPLQSLMKDQVDNLEERGLAEAVTINGLLSPIERKEALERVMNGGVSLLYISPEQLRSKTIEKVMLCRNIVRFVIDEAHCFSAWGHDFRVDYLYIAEFIRELQKKKCVKQPIAISCFTATAKQKVIYDICDYFKKELNLDLEIYATTATRKNLKYAVLYKETEDEKYITLRSLIEAKNCSTIVYVSRTKRTIQLAEKLTRDGFIAKPFNGKMDVNEKIDNQEAFIKNEVQIIVATSAFGMGVDKKDVGLVVHYDISDSLENYVQEAGRAGRDQSIDADCYVLFSNDDLNKHFILLNQTKLTMNEIQLIWKAIKDMTKDRKTIMCSALEIARQAGWNDTVPDIETRVRTAISALETAGYIKRGRNQPRVYATSILVKNMAEAAESIEKSDYFELNEKQDAKRIIKLLISRRSNSKTGANEAEGRVDYIADELGLKKEVVINLVNKMREISILEDSQDMSAYIKRTESQNKAIGILEKFAKLENFILNNIQDEGSSFNLKELNDSAVKSNILTSSVNNIKKISYFWIIKGYMQKTQYNSQNRTDFVPTMSIEKLREKLFKRHEICRFIVEELYRKSSQLNVDKEQAIVEFSLVGLFNAFAGIPRLHFNETPVVCADVEDALLYLSKIGAISLQGGFLVLYNAMEITRLVLDNKIKYKNEDYRLLNEFYKQKIRQIHIVGEYANLMVRDYKAALQFVNDYFSMDFKKFIAKYFKGNRAKEIERNMTPEKYEQLFGTLSQKQSNIIDDDESKYIVVAAGPGSGKTRVLVHKLASLLQLEDVKHEQLLMVTFSRAAATEFKKRLMKLIGNSAAFVEIKTFHSYCFDLLGKVGNIEASNNVVKDASDMINNGDVELGRITKAVIVIDEAQDMDENAFDLIKALISRNDDMRIIAVGDDDQNIYQFRGSDSKYLKQLVSSYDATIYEMTENYRSCKNIVLLANSYARSIRNRLKLQDGVAVNGKDGIVKIINHTSKNLEIPIVDQIIKKKHTGSVCVLTNTNDEALRVLGLLNKYQIPSKLIQSTEGFKIYNLVEIRYFLQLIDKDLKSPIIADYVWEQAIKKFIDKYGSCASSEICLKMLTDFQQTNKIKYRSDLEEFIKESRYEDFYSEEKGTVLVSTIHKSKGREFDVVYMMLNYISDNSDADKRKVYVGLTRAKEELYVHCTNGFFDNINIDKSFFIKDTNEYDEPAEIMLELSHKDVVLSYFKEQQNNIAKLKSGDVMRIGTEFLEAKIDDKFVKVLKFSNAFKTKLKALEERGYYPTNATIRFIVEWKGKEDKDETTIVLPDVCFERFN